MRLRFLIPGLLVAATGVGAGDLITASLAGGFVGLALVGVPILGAILKLVLNEGLARYQLVTGRTLIEGWNEEVGAWVKPVFLIYLVIWSFIVAGALMNACGVAAHAFFPLSEEVRTSKAIWGIIQSVAALLLLRLGSFRLFSTLMAAAVAVMFVLVFLICILMFPGVEAWRQAFGDFRFDASQVNWTLALFGGVGGTVTVLSYGYWLRENRESGVDFLETCRIDLTVSYTLIGLFSVAMLIIGHQVGLAEEKSALLPLVIGDAVGAELGGLFEFLFLVGFWCAVFSSLLGVWQGIPYLFADTIKTFGWSSDRIDRFAYPVFQVLIAVIPMVTLFQTFKSVQLAYSILGALFMPFLALTLLILNNRSGRPDQNGWLTNGLLLLTLLVFAGIGILKFVG